MEKSKKYILPCNPINFPLLQEYSIPYEHACVELCSNFKKGHENFYIISNKTEVSNTDDILGFFQLTHSFLFCIPNICQTFTDFYEFANLFDPFVLYFKNKHTRLIVGDSQGCDYFIKLLSEDDITPVQINPYLIMTLETNPVNPPQTLNPDDSIKCCTQNDYDDLFELQKSFLIKEVALKNQQVTDKECSFMLSNMLKNQVVMALLSDTEFVSKANTNAIGPHWIQLGGIYTKPLFRQNYYAWHLIYNLCLRIQKNNKKISLFVKERNTPALQLYKKIGFTPAGNLTIVYL